jgi:hypothetical protein
MSKHTPGPWLVREPNGPGMGWRVGPAWLGDAPWSDETRADAQLISAAPDMLAALQRLLLTPGIDAESGDACIQARAAIAKAKAQP